MVDYQTLSIVLTGIGMVIALTYYALQIRNQNKRRQTQIFMQIYQQLNTEKSFKTFAELMNLECEDYDEFLRKYDSSVNPESYGKRSHIWWSYNTIGVLLQDGLIESDIVYRLLGLMIIMQWQKWSGIIEEIRKNENVPDNLLGFEHLYIEMNKVRERMKYPEIAYGQPYKEHPELRT